MFWGFLLFLLFVGLAFWVLIFLVTFALPLWIWLYQTQKRKETYQETPGL